MAWNRVILVRNFWRKMDFTKILSLALPHGKEGPLDKGGYVAVFKLKFNGEPVSEKRDTLSVMIKIRSLLERDDCDKIEIVKETD
ncbi:MAG: hypothetical protein ACYCQJ_12780 [Nitrososphaerales archaeon]